MKLSDLSQYTGSESYFRDRLTGLIYTDGVKAVAENGGGQGAYWLIQAIGSYQKDKRLQTEELQQIQFWHLEVKPDRSAVLTCRADSGIPPAITQNIQYTDFEFSIDLWIENGPEDGQKCLLLPSEH